MIDIIADFSWEPHGNPAVENAPSTRSTINASPGPAAWMILIELQWLKLLRFLAGIGLDDIEPCEHAKKLKCNHIYHTDTWTSWMCLI